MLDSKDLDKFCQAILGKGDLADITTSSNPKGLYVYQMNYLFAHIQALTNKFGSLYILLGEENFHYFSRKYILKNPSKNENLDRYGEDFHIFLSEQPELSELFYLKDLGVLDLFWFEIQASLKNKVTVAKGTYIVWEALCNNSELGEVAILTSEEETIFRIQEKGEFFLGIIDDGD